MNGLIRKDVYYLLSGWKPLLLSILVVGAFTTYKGFGAIFIVLLPTFIGATVIGCVQLDAQKKWYDYYKILPVLSQNIVASRYISYLIFVGIGFIITFIYGYGVEMSLGLESLGKHFALWQGFLMGIALALGFASFFIPATYYNKGEKMEVSMMMSGLASFGAIYLASKVLSFYRINLMDYADIFIQILFIVSFICFIVSWIVSYFIYKKHI